MNGQPADRFMKSSYLSFKFLKLLAKPTENLLNQNGSPFQLGSAATDECGTESSFREADSAFKLLNTRKWVFPQSINTNHVPCSSAAPATLTVKFLPGREEADRRNREAQMT